MIIDIEIKENSMRILYVVDSTRFGGVEKFIINLAEEVQRTNRKDIFVTRESKLSEKLIRIGVDVRIINFEDIFRKIVELTKILREDIDLIVAHRWNAIITSIIANRHTKIPVISVVHSLYQPGTRWEQETTQGVYDIPQLIQNSCVKIIAVSKAVANALIEAGIDRKKITIIYNGTKETGYKKKKRINAFFTIGFVGSISHEKGPDLFFNVIRNLPPLLYNNIRIVFVGSGPMQEEIEKKIKNLKVEYKFYGFLENPYEIMSQFDIMMVTSRQEGFPMAVLEAMSMEIPILAFAIPSLCEVLDDDITGKLIFDSEIEDVGEKIEDLYQHPSKLEKMGKQARKKWEEKYQWEICMKKHMETYELIYKTLS
ncbi:MAG: glycosyltransferase family 4 protein [Dorea sp.]|uniref:glycosyltransferase family 4 protein n=1 Tax=Ruminococcus sp. TaxID=41978 RepID=UPI0039958DB6